MGLLGLLAALGAGFDCASEAEVEAVLALGVTPDRIVFANACKRNQDIRYHPPTHPEGCLLASNLLHVHEMDFSLNFIVFCSDWQ